MTARELVDQWSDDNVMGGDCNGLIVMDGYDDCIVGIGSRFGCEPFVIYDIEKVLAKLQADGMTYEEAVEFHEFNQVGAWVGPHTPAFVRVMTADAEVDRLKAALHCSQNELSEHYCIQCEGFVRP